MPADRSHVTRLERQTLRELPLHVDQPLHRIRRAAIEFVREGLRRKDIRYRTGEASRSVEPRFGGEIWIVVVPRASGGVPPDVEPRIALVLVVEHPGAQPYSPLRVGTPCQSDPGREVVVIAIDESIAEASILDERNVGPPYPQARIRIARGLP